MQKISDVLKESNIHQITGDLIRFKWIDKDGEFGFYSDEIIGKCALGVLACESGVDHLKLGKNHTTVRHSEILDAYDIDDDYTYPILDHPAITGKEIGWNFENQEHQLSSIIIRLNDTFKFTFDEIADFLEVTFDL